MTLSNFDWTDKASVKWFIMLPTGHEGPYSLNTLISKKISPEVKLWAEGLGQSVAFKVALEKSQQTEEDELPPPLPPLPQEDDEDLEIPSTELKAPEGLEPLNHNRKKITGLLIGVIALIVFGTKEWVKSKEFFSVKRVERMDPEIHERIHKDLRFDQWSTPIFFKEYVPADLSSVWLVTSGFQECEVEAQFSSLPEKLLSMKNEKISFKSKSHLKDHIVTFSQFEFISGSKIVPGLYEMDIKASQCKWGTLAAKLGNFFSKPAHEYVSRMKVVLYHKGNLAFNKILFDLIRKKLDLEVVSQNQEDLFWQDLQQKLQTLLAISMQIEQHQLDFLESNPKSFTKMLKVSVDSYTKKYGGTLTEFVIQNENYFLELENSGLGDMVNKKPYEKLIRLTSKNIGLTSMRIIEELQKMKNPSKKDLEKMGLKVKHDFGLLKEDLNAKILQITEDRVK